MLLFRLTKQVGAIEVLAKLVAIWLVESPTELLAVRLAGLLVGAPMMS